MDTAKMAACPNCFGDMSAPPCPHCSWQPGADNPPQALPLGTLLDGRYRIGRVLGHGGFGITYLAWDENLQLRLAIKEYLPRDCATREPDGGNLAIDSGAAAEQFAYGLDRFLDEARALARFNQHPVVVAVKSFFRAHGTGYCVMDYVEGLTLNQYLERQPDGRIPVEQAWRLLQPVMDALRAVHKEGLLHRDLAPDNIYITREGRVKLLGFGAARFAAGEHSRSLSINLRPGYAPAEQYRSRGTQGPWTDVYGLAATLYRAITGTPPPEALDRLDEDELVAPSRLGIAITAGQEAVLLKALAVRSGERFPSVEAWKQAWQTAVTQASATSETPSAKEGMATSHPTRRTPSKTQARPPRPVKAQQYILTVLLLLTLVAGLGFGLLAQFQPLGQGSASLLPQIDPVDARTPVATKPAPSTDTLEDARSAYKAGDFARALRILQLLAERGDAEAQLTLGATYDLGDGVAQDDVQAVSWYRKAAEQGNAAAQYLLAAMYGNGRGVAQDDVLAASWYRRAAEQGNAAAQFSLAGMYEHGQGVPQDDVLAVSWIRKAAEQGDAGAQFSLGWRYQEGHGVVRDDVQAVSWYRKAAEQGNAAAQFSLAGMYARGDGVAQDDVQAASWLRKAAEQGYAYAQFGLGGMYEHGDGVAQDYVQAVSWYRKAAEQGHAAAQFSLGWMYEHGQGVVQDHGLAVSWYRKAAEQGEALAQNNLGLMYIKGQGVAQDDVKAAGWIRKAAEQGDAAAQFNLGLMYMKGHGVPQDDVQAVSWYRKAAEQGYADAQFNLGVMYEKGRGVKQDNREAVSWYRKAAEQGYVLAQQALDAWLGRDETRETPGLAPAPQPTSAQRLSDRYRPVGARGAVIEDTTTGLQWMRCSQGQDWNGVTCDGDAVQLTWDVAMQQPRRFLFAGYTDWRMPTKAELRTMVYCSSDRPEKWKDSDDSCNGDYERPAIDQVAFPKTPKSGFWSSSPAADLSTYAWYVAFSGVGSVGYDSKNFPKYVRLVRGGQ